MDRSVHGSAAELARRVCLEGRVEILEAARPRYAALLTALGRAPGMPSRPEVLALVREVAVLEPAVTEALPVVARRARLEGWPDESEVCEIARALTQLREALVARLRCAPLQQALLRAEAQALTRHRRAARLWQTGLEALPRTDRLVISLERFADAADALLASPDLLVALASEDFDWQAGERNLQGSWARLTRAEPSGRLVRLLRRARHAPEGLGVLLHAQRADARLTARLDALLREHLAPMSWTGSERLELGRWLGSHDGAVPAVSPSRAPLFAFARALTERHSSPGGLLMSRAKVAPLASAADACSADPDWQRLRDATHALVVNHLRARDENLPPLYRVGRTRSVDPLPRDASLVELVAALENAAAGKPGRTK